MFPSLYCKLKRRCLHVTSNSVAANMIGIYRLGLYLLLFESCIGDYNRWNIQLLCSDLYPRVFISYLPRGNLTDGTYVQQIQSLSNMQECVMACCKKPLCNVAFTHNSTCYHVECENSMVCVPLYRPELANNPPSMVLVRPVESNKVWSDFLDQVNEDNNVG